MINSELSGPFGMSPRQRAKSISESYLGRDGNLYTDLQIGMPLMGRCNLAESPLLKEIGHIRWLHLEALTGVPSAAIADEDGNRLYATFFFVEIVFPPHQSMAAIAENDEITVVSTLRRFGHLVLDGEHYLCPRVAEFQPDAGSLKPETAPTLGIPFLRLTNVFVRQVGGADWLKKGCSTQVPWSEVPQTTQAPTSMDLATQARLSGSFDEPEPTFTPLTAEAMEATYRIVPDRDINGVGLLYFANYSRYLDICEREALLALPHAGLGGGLLDSRSLLHRRSAYFSNATEDDSIEARIECSVENPFLTGDPRPDDFPVTLHFDYQLRRRSDRRLMLVSSARKTLVGKVLGDTRLLEHLAEQSRRDHSPELTLTR